MACSNNERGSYDPWTSMANESGQNEYQKRDPEETASYL